MNETPRLMRTFPAAGDEQVTLANMQEGPFNRWAFRNLRRMLPTGNVWSGDGEVTELPVQSLYLDDIEFPDKNGATMTVKQMLDSNYTDGFVVLHQGTTSCTNSLICEQDSHSRWQ
ncbi:MAG: hypothetical protein P8Q36_01065 [Alphaproteobacteria bacterium]|nr:hypothetical protein [Rhodospirillaceae bacterium]MBT6204798.1 hypothetical protein [Rhodospirillaceae bacterium]MBT7615011.1 hypothetical protein [Rhodospirillaceae bacterium]MDG2479446.1 hypothetical protein [Alphaproteobacteria bacterium]